MLWPVAAKLRAPRGTFGRGFAASWMQLVKLRAGCKPAHSRVSNPLQNFILLHTFMEYFQVDIVLA
jgi:hypothetical protein